MFTYSTRPPPICRRHPREYKLIGLESALVLQSGEGFPKDIVKQFCLMRLHPDKQIPEGFVELHTIGHATVYTEAGRLAPKFQGLKRYTEEY